MEAPKAIAKDKEPEPQAEETSAKTVNDDDTSAIVRRSPRLQSKRASDSSTPTPNGKVPRVSWPTELVSRVESTYSASEYDRSFTLDAYTCDLCFFFIAGTRHHCRLCTRIDYDVCDSCFRDESKFLKKPDKQCPHEKKDFVEIGEGDID